MRLPIRWKLVLWYVLSVTVIVAALAVFLVLELRANETAAVERSANAAAAEIEAAYALHGKAAWQRTASDALRSLPRDDTGAQVVDRSGAVLLTYGDDVAQRLVLPDPALRSARRGNVVVRTLSLGATGEPFSLAARPVTSDGGRLIVVATSLQSVQASVNRLIALLALAGPVALLVTAGGGWWIARKALLPVSRMREGAEAITVDRLDARVSVANRSDEIGRLAVTFNAMLDRLQRGVENQRRFVADASHELRTPLAVMRSEVDVALMDDELSPAGRAVLLSVREEIDRMSRMAADLLLLAKADEGELGVRPAPVDLGRVTRAVCAEVEDSAAGKQIAVTVTGGAEPVTGDEDHLRQVLRNLLDNALEYTPRGGSISVRLWKEGSRSGATVTDTGPGIAKEAVPRIFDRFVSADHTGQRSRPGSGLGLAICRAIMEAQAGDLWVDTEVGRGSSFSFSLPRTSPGAGAKL